jgi:hypothetical protein
METTWWELTALSLNLRLEGMQARDEFGISR